MVVQCKVCPNDGRSIRVLSSGHEYVCVCVWGGGGLCMCVLNAVTITYILLFSRLGLVLYINLYQMLTRLR